MTDRRDSPDRSERRLRGGLLGRPVELHVEDSATDDEIAHTAAARLVREADVDVVIGGIYSSTRQAINRPGLSA